MIKVEITTETIERANSYVDLLTKTEFAKYVSQRMFDSLKVTADDGKNGGKVLPSLNKLNAGLRKRYLMGAFVKLYLMQDYDPVEGDDALMSQDDYDNYAGSHIFNEMNRLKSNSAIRDKVFDILSDFKELTEIVDTETEGILAALNDPVSRIYMTLTQMATPEEISGLLDDINSKRDEIDDYIKTMKEGVIPGAEEIEQKPEDGKKKE